MRIGPAEISHEVLCQCPVDAGILRVFQKSDNTVVKGVHDCGFAIAPQVVLYLLLLPEEDRILHLKGGL